MLFFKFLMNVYCLSINYTSSLFMCQQLFCYLFKTTIANTSSILLANASSVNNYLEYLVGFEPTTNGFAIHRI